MLNGEAGTEAKMEGFLQVRTTTHAVEMRQVWNAVYILSLAQASQERLPLLLKALTFLETTLLSVGQLSSSSIL